MAFDKAPAGMETAGHGRQRLRGRLLISFRAQLICAATEAPAPWQGLRSPRVPGTIRPFNRHPVLAGPTSFACVRLPTRAGLLGEPMSFPVMRPIGSAT